MAELLDSLPAGPVLRTCMQYSIAFCSRLEAASDVKSDKFGQLIVSDQVVKFPDPCLNCSPEIRSTAVGGGIFDIFFVTTSNRSSR